MRILLTGRTGQIGRDLHRLLDRVGDCVATSRSELDLLDVSSIRHAIAGLRPDVIVNAAGYTHVDRAEHEPDVAMHANANAPRILAEEARRHGAAIIHLSTDYVFDGRADSPYRVDDQTAPLNAYGRSKLAGEQAIRIANDDHIIVRTSWIYSATGRNFLRTMLRLGEERTHLDIVDDQVGSPTSSLTVARAVTDMIRQRCDGHFDDRAGTYHVSCTGEATWFEFAQAIFAMAQPEHMPSLRPIPTSAYSTPAERPRYSVLDVSKAIDTFGLALPSWREGLTEVFEHAWATGELKQSVEGRP